MRRQLDFALGKEGAGIALLIIGFACLGAGGCEKKVTEEQGKAMMASFKGGPETAADRAGDAKDVAAAAEYRKQHPELFPEPKYNVTAPK